jgi:perosamine synthetase
MCGGLIMERIPIAGPSISQREIDYATDAAATGWYDGAGDYPRRFERAFASYLGVKHAVSLPSCTSGLHLALAALGIGPGDEVIVPDVTWIASAAPINYVGASAVFADVDERTWCLSPQSVRECVTEKTKAILSVDLYGGVSDYEGLRQIAEEHELKIVEDAAEAFGSEFEGRKAGTLGDVAAFSFHGSKTMSTGEGGMLVTDDDDLHARVMYLRDHGREPGDMLFRNTEVAFKYKMPSVSAAIGLGQVERAEELVARKREIFNWYNEAFSEAVGIQLNHEPSNSCSWYCMVHG